MVVFCKHDEGSLEQMGNSSTSINGYYGNSKPNSFIIFIGKRLHTRRALEHHNSSYVLQVAPVLKMVVTQARRKSSRTDMSFLSDIYVEVLCNLADPRLAEVGVIDGR